MNSKPHWFSDLPHINARNIVVFWLGFALFLSVCSAVTFSIVNKPFSFPSLLAGNVICCLLWALFTPFILWLSRYFFIRRPNALLKLAFHLGASLAVSLVHLSSFTLVFSLIRKWAVGDAGSFADELADLVTFYLNTDLLYYWCVVLIFHGMTYLKRFREKELTAAQLQEKLAHANLQALKMQFHPHFLFNALNSVASLIRLKRMEGAITTLSDLSDMLRQSMAYSGEQMTSIADEFALIEKYLAIERRRFPDRMKVKIEVSPSCESAQIPAFLLQPLVENAIKHAVAVKNDTVFIEILVSRGDSALNIEVIDDGPGLSEAAILNRNQGIGLNITRSRLAQLFPDQHQLEINNRETGGVRVSISIPYRLGDSEDSDGEDPHAHR